MISSPYEMMWDILHHISSYGDRWHQARAINHGEQEFKALLNHNSTEFYNYLFDSTVHSITITGHSINKCG
jgi:hypothetical protein